MQNKVQPVKISSTAHTVCFCMSLSQEMPVCVRSTTRPNLAFLRSHTLIVEVGQGRVDGRSDAYHVSECSSEVAVQE